MGGPAVLGKRGERMSAEYREKLRSLALRGDRRGARQTTRDELGHDTTEHWGGCVDVNIRAPRVRAVFTQKEERHVGK